MKNSIIELKGIGKESGNKRLKNINIIVEEKNFISIFGEQGSGKTTLTNIIGLIEGFDEGEYLIEGRKIHSSTYCCSRIISEKIGFVFQNYSLLKNMTVRENILFSFINNEQKKYNIDILAEKLEIKNIMGKKVKMLKEVDKQKVAIARTMSLNPSIILADEPTGNFINEEKKEIIKLLRIINNTGCAILLMTKDKSVASQAHIRYKLRNGFLYACK